jgi:hypothetical protein
MSMSRVAAHRPVAMKGNHGPYQPTNLDLSPSQLTQSGEGKRSSSSDSDLAVDMVQGKNALELFNQQHYLHEVVSLIILFLCPLRAF